MTATIRDVQAGPSAKAALRRIIADPRNTPKLKAIARREVRQMAEAGEAISETDLNRRPSDRRTRESLAHGAEYHDSWATTEPRLEGDRIIAKAGNTHPFAPAVEAGTPAHAIVPRAGGPGVLKFPFNGGGRGAPNRKGAFAVAWGEAPTMRSNGVGHPGAVAHRIMYRAVIRWKSQSRLRRR